MSEPAPSLRENPFEQRFAIWADLRARFGSARSYPYAWRLPELARDQGAGARFRAALALAETLYEMGRFGAARDSLPDADGGPADAAAAVAASLDLRARCAWQRGETDTALALAEAARRSHPDRLAALGIHTRFLFLADAPEAALPCCRDYRDAARDAGSAVDLAWSALLIHWAECRLGEASAPAPPHAALALLRATSPTAAAQGEAVHAEAVFHQSRAASLVWLEHALAQGESYGQHHLKARLLALKADALDACGLLSEAARFRKLARETAERQGAWRYARDMAA